MSRAFTFVTIGLVLLVTIYVQDLAMEMFGPGSGLYEMVAEVDYLLDGEAWAERMYVAVTVWFMWIIRIGAIVAGLYREFRRENVTSARVAGGRPP